MGSVQKKMERLKVFYFRRGPYIALTGGLWLYYLIASSIVIFLSGRREQRLLTGCVPRFNLFQHFYTFIGGELGNETIKSCLLIHA